MVVRVLTAALVNPGIASLSILARERDKEGWLQEHLDVEFPQKALDVFTRRVIDRSVDQLP